MAKKKLCPLIHKPCIEHDCEFWHSLIFTAPDGSSTTQFKCIYHWIPLLLIEQAKESRHTAASMDKVATEIRGAGGELIMKAIGMEPPDRAPAQLEKPR